MAVNDKLFRSPRLRRHRMRDDTNQLEPGLGILKGRCAVYRLQGHPRPRTTADDDQQDHLDDPDAVNST